MRKYIKTAIWQSLKCIILFHECYLLVHIKTFRAHRNIIVSYSILEILSRISIVKTRLEYQFWRHTSRISIVGTLDWNIDSGDTHLEYCFEYRYTVVQIQNRNIDCRKPRVEYRLWRNATGISILETLV